MLDGKFDFLRNNDMRLRYVSPFYKTLVSELLKFIFLPSKEGHTHTCESFTKNKTNTVWEKQACTFKTSDEIFVS